MRHLLAVVFTLLMAGAAAMASEPPSCAGINLLDDLQTRDRALYDQVMAKAAATPNGEAMMWKIETAGAPPSHLVGTAHVSDPRVTRGPAGLSGIIAEADVVALEIAEIGDDQAMAAATLKHARLMVMPPGQSLWDVVPDEHEDLIRSSPNLPGGSAGTLFGYQPWVVAMLLSVPACELAREASGIPAFDKLIARQAARHDVSVVGLETVEEQFTVLSGMSMAMQVDFLVQSARLSPQAADYFETLVALYERRQIAAMMPLSEILEPPSAQSGAILAYIQADLIEKRNRTMAHRADNLLRKGNAVIAVGALHLPGETGLVELLRQAGYKVTPVN